MPSDTLRATILIAVFSILSKVLSAARDAVLAHNFAAGTEVDIYAASFRVPDLLFNLLILGTLSAAFIPVFVGYLRKDREEAFVVAGTIFNLTLLLMAVLSLLGMIFAPQFVKLIVPGFDRQAQEQTVVLTRIMMASPLFFSLSSVLTGVLHSFKKFFLAALAPLFYNLSIIAGILFFYPVLGLPGLAWGVVVGAFLHFAIQLPSVLRLGLRPLAIFQTRHPGVKKIAKLYLPRIFGVEQGQISWFIASVIGSTLGAGSIAVFYFSYNLETFPLGIFAISFAVAAFPTMAEFAGKNDTAGLRQFFAKTAVQVLFFIIPISVIALLLRAQITRLILGAGEDTKFTFEHTRLVAQSLGFFALSLFAQALIPLLARAFYALQNTVIPVVSGLAASAVNIVLAVVLVGFLGVPSLALAFSVSALLNMAVLFFLLHRKLQGLEDEFLILRVLKISIASIIMGVVVYITLYVVAPLVNMQTYLGVLLQTLSALIIGGVSYLLTGMLIRLPETRSLMAMIKIWFSKFGKPVASIMANFFTDIR